MSTPAPFNPKAPSNEPSSSEPVDLLVPSFEDRLKDWWEKNARTVYAVCAVILLVILGRGAWEYYQKEKEAGIRSDYALATSPEKLKSFISQNSSHELAGAASLRLGDEAYQSANYTEAVAQYQRAVDILKVGVLAGRAKLGIAVSKLAAGQAAEGEAALQQLANDVAQLKPLRSEAAYHLAMLAIDSGRTEDAIKALDLASTVDQAGIWAQRAMMLRTTLPAPSTPAPSPTVQAPAP